MNKIHLLFLVFVIMSLSFTVIGCSLLPNTSLEILQYSMEKTVAKDVWTAQITGVAHNDGSARLEYAEIIGNFYSQDGTLLATGFARTIYQEGKQKGEFFTLDPGQIWKFTISYLEEMAYPSLAILECTLVKDSTEAKLVGSAQNDGNVTLAFVKLTGHFLDADGNELTPTGTATVTNLKAGEIWNFTIYFSRYDVDLPQDGYVIIENPDDDLQVADGDVDHVSVEVGVLRWSTIMP